MGIQLRAYLVDQKLPEISRAVWDILVAIDQEFVPPLSQRAGTTETRFSPGKVIQDLPGPTEYYQQVLQQNIVLTQREQEWVGLLSFRQAFLLEAISGHGPCNYVTTIGVVPSSRGIGVARAMYDYVLSNLPAQYSCSRWATRTWSTNDSHIQLLRELQFQLAVTVKDQRAPGIDTLYFVRDSSVLAEDAD